MLLLSTAVFLSVSIWFSPAVSFAEVAAPVEQTSASEELDTIETVLEDVEVVEKYNHSHDFKIESLELYDYPEYEIEIPLRWVILRIIRKAIVVTFCVTSLIAVLFIVVALIRKIKKKKEH